MQYVELKNVTDVPLALKNWSLRDEDDVWSVKSNVSVAPGGYALLVLRGWAPSVPDGVPVVMLNAKRKGLDPTGGHLELIDPGGAAIDRISWGDDTWVFNPALPAPPFDQSLSRLPDGTDTNTAVDFTVQAPSPGLSNDTTWLPVASVVTPTQTPPAPSTDAGTLTPAPTETPPPVEAPTETPTPTATETPAAVPPATDTPTPTATETPAAGP